MAKRLSKVLLAGDSISFGYGPKVQRILEGAFDVKNLPENGRTSANLLARMNEWIVKPGFNVIHLNCGLHDIVIKQDTKEHRVPLRQYEANLRKIVEAIRNETDAVLAWATTTPVVDELRQTATSFIVHEQDVSAYNEVALRVMKRFGIPIDDLHKAVEDAGTRRCISTDGLHMADYGYEILAIAVSDFILSMQKQGTLHRG